MPPALTTMNRLLSRRDRNGAGHRRGNSRENGKEEKEKKPYIPKTVTSLCAAFSTPSSKSPPVLITTYSTTHGTIADVQTPLSIQARPLSGDGIDLFINIFKGDPQKKWDKELSKKVHTIRERLHQAGYTAIGDEHINNILTSLAEDDIERGYTITLLIQQSVDGEIKPWDPNVQLLGAVNRENVTCWLDSLMFSMFCRLPNFEPILHTSFDDEPRRRLSTLMRIWVNMVRSGFLVHTDITKHLQEALSLCGWDEAAKIEQQDAAEGFRFITEKLNLPLLTLKVDIFHTGREDDKDDHKYIHERLLEVAVPEASPGDRPITLEQCLESYFNNRVEVQRREVALKRSNTISSIQSGTSSMAEKASAQHVEVSELAWSTPNTPISKDPPAKPLSLGRSRTMSIIRPLTPPDTSEQDGPSDITKTQQHSSTQNDSARNGKGREVIMPAWQFFNLIRPSPIYLHMRPFLHSYPPDRHVLIANIAWYTSAGLGSPTADSGVFASFQKTRPVLGVCLKRYGFADGKPTRNGTYIDIPLDLRLPHFVNDGKNPEDEHLAGNFKLSLQSFICHRGKSTNEGHYISIVRGTSPIPDGDSLSSQRLSDFDLPPIYSEEQWIKFDDLAEPRVSYVNVEEALKIETPYLLFYQIVPLDNSSHDVSDKEHPPSYDSGIMMQATNSSSELGSSPGRPLYPGYFDGTRDESMPTIRLSSDNDRPPTPPRSNSTDNIEERRPSIAFTENSLTSNSPSIPTSVPSTPNEETTAQRISRAAASFTKSRNKSRPTSQSGENRISATFQRLNIMRSKEQLSSPRPEVPKDATVGAEGVAESRKSITIDDRGLKVEDGAIDRSKSKREKKRDKSRGPSEKSDDEKHHHKHKTKAKLKEAKGSGESEKSKGLPERECNIM